jgi:hypothetical protein
MMMCESPKAIRVIDDVKGLPADEKAVHMMRDA